MGRICCAYVNWQMLFSSCTEQRTFKTFQGQAKVSHPTSKNWYISTSGSSIFPLKTLRHEADCTATFALPSKNYVLTMLDLLIHAQTSEIPKVLLRFEASHVLVYIIHT